MIISPEIAKFIQGKSVLIVDDEEGIRMILNAVFGACGAEITEASSGNEAIRIISEKNVDLVISDMRMADGDGVALLAAIRAKDLKCPPFIFITGYSSFTESVALEQGAQAVISKPFSSKDLLRVAQEVMETAKCYCREIA